MTSFIFVMFGITINLLVALSAHRYWAVCRPTSYYVHKQARHVMWIISICVLMGAVLGTLPATIGWNSGIFDGKCFLIDLISFSFIYLCCFWTLGATAIIIALYGLIYKSISDYVRFLEIRLRFIRNARLVIFRQETEMFCLPINRPSGFKIISARRSSK